MSHTRRYVGLLGWAAWSLLTAVALVNCKPRGISPAPSATASTPADCRSNGSSVNRIRVLLDAGRLFRARALAELARARCPDPAVNTLAEQIRSALKSKSNPEDLLREAATARGNREPVRARRLESQALSSLAAKSGAKLKTILATWIGELKGATWSHDNRRLVAWSSSLASVFDAASGRELIRVQAPKGQIYLVGGLSPDARWLVLSSDDEDLSAAQFELYDVESKFAPRRFAGAIAWPGSSWVFSKDGSVIFWLESSGPVLSPKHVLHAADVATFTSRLALELPSVKFDEPPIAAQELTLSPDGQMIVAHRSDPVSEVDRISMVEIASGRAYHFDTVHDGSTATFSASGEKAAWAAPAGIALWDRGANAPRLLHDRRCMAPQPPPGLFSPSEHLLATASPGRVCLWDVAKGRLIAAFPPNASDVDDISSNPRTWVQGDRGLILETSPTFQELWDVPHRRKVMSYLLASSAQGGPPVTLEQSSQDDLWVTEITPNLAPKRTALPQCALKDFCQTGNPDLPAFGQKVVVPCEHNPALVNLANGSTRRLQIWGWKSLDLSNDGAVLASRTRFGLRLYDADSGEQRTPLLSDDEYEATTSSLTLTAGDLQIDQLDPAGHIHRRQVVFGAERLSLSQSEIAPAPCAGTTPRNRNILNSSLAWEESKKLSGIVLCDFASGREAGHLRLEAGGQLVGVNADGTKVVVVTNDSTLLWHPTESKTVALSILGGVDWTFDGSYLVATTSLDAERITVFDAATGEPRMSWQIPIPKTDRRLLAFNATSRLVLMSSDRTTAPWSARHGIAELRKLDDGALVGELPCELQSSAAFGPNGLLAINAGNHVSIWRAPSLERVGEVLMDGKDAAFIGRDGAFETTDPPERWRSRLRCEVGGVALPFDACVDALYQPGAARQAMRAL